MSCQVKYLFAALSLLFNRFLPTKTDTTHYAYVKFTYKLEKIELHIVLVGTRIWLQIITISLALQFLSIFDVSISFPIKCYLLVLLLFLDK